MSYRKIEVNGKEYEYSVGHTHVKFRDGPAVPIFGDAFPESAVVGQMGSDHVYFDTNVRVTPKHIREYIEGNPSKFGQ